MMIIKSKLKIIKSANNIYLTFDLSTSSTAGISELAAPGGEPYGCKTYDR